MRAIALVVAVLGVFTLAIGVVYIFQASSAEQKIQEGLNSGMQPVAMSDVQAKYDAATATMTKMNAAELQNAQAGKPVSDNYLKVVNQRTAYGLSLSNIGLAQGTRMNGILNVVIGAALLLTAVVIFSRRASFAAAK